MKKYIKKCISLLGLLCLVLVYISAHAVLKRDIASRNMLLSDVTNPVVLNLGSIEPQGFGESVSGVRRQEIFEQ